MAIVVDGCISVLDFFPALRAISASVALLFLGFGLLDQAMMYLWLRLCQRKFAHIVSHNELAAVENSPVIGLPWNHR